MQLRQQLSSPPKIISSLEKRQTFPPIKYPEFYYQVSGNNWSYPSLKYNSKHFSAIDAR